MAEMKTETAAKAAKITTASKKSPVAAKAEKPEATRAVAKKTAAPKAASKPRATKSKSGITPEQRYLMICEAAYYKAESRGFSPENEIQDWLDAEFEINRMLGM